MVRGEKEKVQLGNLSGQGTKKWIRESKKGGGIWKILAAMKEKDSERRRGREKVGVGESEEDMT